MGCVLSAASCNKWWSEEVLHTTDYAAEQTPITADKLGANDVYFLPYLMGERTPHNVLPRRRVRSSGADGSPPACRG